MKRIFRYLLILALLAVITGVLVGLYLFNKKHPDLANVRADYIMTAPALYAEFEADEQAATLKYVDKVIQVSGTVTLVEVNADSTINVTLGDESQMGGVICTFRGIPDPAGSGFVPGTEVVIKGVCSGMLMDVLLNNCAPARK